MKRNKRPQWKPKEPTSEWDKFFHDMGQALRQQAVDDFKQWPKDHNAVKPEEQEDDDVWCQPCQHEAKIKHHVPNPSCHFNVFRPTQEF